MVVVVKVVVSVVEVVVAVVGGPHISMGKPSAP